MYTALSNSSTIYSVRTICDNVIIDLIIVWGCSFIEIPCTHPHILEMCASVVFIAYTLCAEQMWHISKLCGFAVWEMLHLYCIHQTYSVCGICVLHLTSQSFEGLQFDVASQTALYEWVINLSQTPSFGDVTDQSYTNNTSFTCAAYTWHVASQTASCNSSKCHELSHLKISRALSSEYVTNFSSATYDGHVASHTAL